MEEQTTVTPTLEEVLKEEEMSREDDQHLFHSHKKQIVTKYKGLTIMTGQWVYYKAADVKRSLEKEPDVIESCYHTYYGELFVNIRLGNAMRRDPVRIPLHIEDMLKALERGDLEILDMPKYRFAEKFVNKWNKESLTIRDVPRSKNDELGEFVYYVRTYSLKEGFNYKAIRESAITEFYRKEGSKHEPNRNPYWPGHDPRRVGTEQRR